MQEVHDVRTRCHLLIERARASIAHGLQPVDRHHREHLDELAIAVCMFSEPLTESRHRAWKVPVLERRPIA